MRLECRRSTHRRTTVVRRDSHSSSSRDCCCNHSLIFGAGGQQGETTVAIDKARAIAMRFQQEEEVIGDASIPNDVDYSQKRREHFERETLRLSAFRLKNLEYVMKCEEAELRRHVDAIDQMTQYEERLQIQTELQDRQRREMRMKLEENTRR